MRVTNQLITRNSQSRLQTVLQGIDRLREDISSGMRLRKMSDDPAAAGEVVRIGSSMRAITQFRRNIDVGLARASAEEAVLNQLSNDLSRAVELGVAQASATANAQTRAMVKGEVDQLISQAVSIGNTKFGDDYLLGGTRAGEPPLRLPPTPADGFSALTLGRESRQSERRHRSRDRRRPLHRAVPQCHRRLPVDRRAGGPARPLDRPRQQRRGRASGPRPTA